MTVPRSEEDWLPRRDVPERWRLRPFYVPKTRYIDRDYLQLELERVFSHTWLVACRLEEIPDVGDYVEFVPAGESILIVRQSAEKLKAFFNSCRHRGTRLARGRGRVGNLRCPFHAWQYALDGTCQYVHDEDDFSHLSAEYLCLRECQIGTWGGWVFINMDPGARPLEQHLAPLPDRLDRLNIGAMRYSWHKTFTLACNWKSALDAFSESYHVPGTHPQLLRAGDHSLRAASRRELENDPSHAPSTAVGPYVARFAVAPRDPARPRNSTKEALAAITEYHIQELRALHTRRDLETARELEGSEVQDGPTLSAAFKERVRERAHADGLDWPEIDPEELRRAEGNYVVFPNMIFLVRQGALLGYRSCPNGLDPDSCIFDAYALELYPPGNAPEFSPQSFADWREGDVGEVLTQDFCNVEDVRMGLHSTAFEGATLSPLQEVGVFQRHMILDEMMFGDPHDVGNSQASETSP